MPLTSQDYQQVCIYLRYAVQLLERDSALRTVKTREVLELIARRLTPGSETFTGNVPAEITVLRGAGEKAGLLHTDAGRSAKESIAKAVAILRDRD